MGEDGGMRAFVLGTGRCGTTTLVRAFEHATNLTAAHESRIGVLGAGRLDYPDRHVEADMRLSWFLGPLISRFPDAVYVHLERDRDAVVQSFLARWHRQARRDGTLWRPKRLARELWRRARGREPRYPQGVIRAFGNVVIEQSSWAHEWTDAERRVACEHYVDTVTENLTLALSGVEHVRVRTEEAEVWFPGLWGRVGAEGDLDAAVRELGVRHNAEVHPTPAA